MPDALVEAVRGLRVAEPDIGFKPLLAKLRAQQPDLGAAIKEVREAIKALKAESETAEATEAPSRIATQPSPTVVTETHRICGDCGKAFHVCIPPASPPTESLPRCALHVRCMLPMPPTSGYHTHQVNDTVSFKRHTCWVTVNTQTLAELLFGFFVHYAELRMDQAVSVATASIVPRPGSGWTFERFCILDPLAPDEDLGRHLTPETLPVLRRELARARLELASGKALTAVLNGKKCHGRNKKDATALKKGQLQTVQSTPVDGV